MPVQVGARGSEEIRVALAERDEKIAELERQIADAAKADELLVAAQPLSLRNQKSWHGSTQRVIIHAFILFAGGCLYDFVNHRDTPEQVRLLGTTGAEAQ